MKTRLAFILCAGATLFSPSARSSSFETVQPMGTARYFHTATLLNNGKVLFAGGTAPVNGGYATTKSAELYDPATGTFTPAGDMITDRDSHTATLLPNGKVLIAGGVQRAANGVSTYLNSVELYDPATGTFTSTGVMNSAREMHTATLLRNGKILIAGGDSDRNNATNNTAEVYDPGTGTFTVLANPMTEKRSAHTATLLPNGSVLLTGGYFLEGPFATGIDSAELFDPTSETFTAVASPLSSVRYYHTATSMPNGKVLVAGGAVTGNIPVIGAIPTVTNVSHTADLFDPATGTFTVVSPSEMVSARASHTATLLPNGKVLLSGGYNGGASGPVIASTAWNNTAEVFDPDSNSFTSLPSIMSDGRDVHTATLLADGRVLVAGGFDGTVLLNTAELYDYSSGSFSSAQPLNIARESHTATQLPDGRVLIAGGIGTQPTIGMAELYDSATGTFSPASNTMIAPRYAHTATSLANGKVLIAAGLAGTSLLDIGPSDKAELFDPGTATFMATGTMTSPRVEHTATLLPNGKVLLAGGYKSQAYMKTAELYDPQSETFTAVSHPMPIERHAHTATLLNNGKVLIAGGEVGQTSLVTNTAELFDPLTQTFTSLTSTMAVGRAYHTATLLPNGKVLLAGGFATTSEPYYTETTELFDPVSNTFTAGPSMLLRRYGHCATLLANGRVLIAGGVSQAGAGPQGTAEVFDPVFGTMTSLLPNTMVNARGLHTATLLPSGQILICGGGDMTGAPLSAAELFDAGLAFSNSRRPFIASATDPLIMPASLVLNGSGFRGDSEGSGGWPQSSASNIPVVQLMRVDNDQIFLPFSNSATNWSDTTFSSETLGATATRLPVGQYRVTVFTNGVPSRQKMVEINGTTVPEVPLTSIVSRKAHGNFALFDIPLPASGSPGIECRSGGANSDHTIVFTFPNQLASVDGASLSGGSGTVSSAWMSGDRYQYVVNLTGVINAQTVTINLTNIVDSVANFSRIVSISMGVLAGDTNADGVVNSADIGQTKSQSGQSVGASNFREDVNTDGFVNSADIGLVKSKSGTGLP